MRWESRTEPKSLLGEVVEEYRDWDGQMKYVCWVIRWAEILVVSDE